MKNKCHILMYAKSDGFGSSMRAVGRCTTHNIDDVVTIDGQCHIGYMMSEFENIKEAIAEIKKALIK